MHDVIATAGLLASITGLVGGLPHARHVWRHRREPSALQGISLASFAVALVGNVMWTVYGVGIGSFWVAAPCAVNGPIAVLTLVVVGRSKRRVRPMEGVEGASASTTAAPATLPQARVVALAHRSTGRLVAQRPAADVHGLPAHVRAAG
ncbi:hypothetical protein [Cellulomonas marina]|uniref:MtN3 and saliva related transmembrane protein n=1 Tax=Cellulomonas marina TaxID=988821 RepID=A0A1I0ZAC5_9CELL|nr:hypothetical protein [Cellulomonas marina]GIG29007.1 hypothetical protein Cma02nite_16070 [Cellulomonas marina]SFB22307.1 hypothetical protein SAMN05421867_11066 [Cellulomonas marina]